MNAFCFQETCSWKILAKIYFFLFCLVYCHHFYARNRMWMEKDSSESIRLLIVVYHLLALTLFSFHQLKGRGRRNESRLWIQPGITGSLLLSCCLSAIYVLPKDLP